MIIGLVICDDDQADRNIESLRKVAINPRNGFSVPEWQEFRESQLQVDATDRAEEV